MILIKRIFIKPFLKILIQSLIVPVIWTLIFPILIKVRLYQEEAFALMAMKGDCIKDLAIVQVDFYQ